MASLTDDLNISLGSIQEISQIIGSIGCVIILVLLALRKILILEILQEFLFVFFKEN